MVWPRKRLLRLVRPARVELVSEYASGKEGYQAISDKIMQAIARLECPPDLLPKPR